jgi:hypothetical protein
MFKRIDRSPPNDLKEFRTTVSTVYLHRDASFMPRERSLWCSWNVVKRDDGSSVVSYWVHKLQHVADTNLFITLIPGASPPRRAPNAVLWQRDMTHAQMSAGVFDAQRALHVVNDAGGFALGNARAFVCGAWLGTCFHEAGAATGMRAAAAALTRVLDDEHAGDRVPHAPLWPDAGPRRCWVFDRASTTHASHIDARNQFTYKLDEVIKCGFQIETNTCCRLCVLMWRNHLFFYGADSYAKITLARRVRH